MTDWTRICPLDDIPRLGARVVQRAGGADIALFRTAGDEVFALHDRCPHKGGPLSQGIVHGRKVTCPLHGWNFDLQDGEAVAPDTGRCARLAVKLEGGQVFLAL
ncbi:MAG: nitrite reductase small subunit NirD [Gammaproteobacteria bacterium]|nr:nitrite reductase small subunit [Rhodocyclaceae bacterium]